MKPITRLAYCAAYKRILQEKKVRLVDEFESSQIDNNDWLPILPRVKQGNPEAVVFFLGKDDVDLLVRRMSELSIKLPLFGASHTYDAFIAFTTNNVFLV